MKFEIDPSSFEPIISATVQAALASVRDNEQRAAGVEIFTESEAAAWLKVAPYVLRDLRLRGEIHARRVGKSHRYTRAELLSFLAR